MDKYFHPFLEQQQIGVLLCISTQVTFAQKGGQIDITKVMSTFTLRVCAVILFLVLFMNLIFGIDFKDRDGYKQLQRCSPFLFSYQSLHFEPKSISGIRFLFNSKLILFLLETLSTLGRKCDILNHLASRHYPYFFSDQYIF